MENDKKPYIVYVKADDQGRIYDVNSSAFLRDTEGWTEIDCGYGDRFHHAQGNFFEKPIFDERGIHRYQAYPFVDAPPGMIIARFFKDGVEYLIFERTQAEMDADYVPQEEKPSDAERIAMLEEQNAMLTECVLEMSAMLYA